MSRSGRAIELLSEWKDHPKGCTAEHGWKDGYDGPCNDDPWDIIQSLGQIDPFFRHAEIDRLRRALQAGMSLEEYDRLAATPQGRDGLEALPAAPKPEA